MKILAKVWNHIARKMQRVDLQSPQESQSSSPHSKPTKTRLSRSDIDKELETLNLFDMSKETVSKALDTLLENVSQNADDLAYVLSRIIEFAKIDHKRRYFCFELIKGDSFSFYSKEKATFTLSAGITDQLVQIILDEALSPNKEFQSISDLAWSIINRSPKMQALKTAAIRAKDLITAEMVAGYVGEDEKTQVPLCTLFSNYFAFLGRSEYEPDELEVRPFLERTLPLLKKSQGSGGRNWEIRKHIEELIRLYAKQVSFDDGFFRAEILPEIVPILKDQEPYSSYKNETFMKLLLDEPKILKVILPRPQGLDEISFLIAAAEAALGESIYQEKYLWLTKIFAEKFKSIKSAKTLDSLFATYVKMLPSVSAPWKVISAVKELEYEPATKINLDEKLISFLSTLDLDIEKDWGLVSYVFSVSKTEWSNPKWVAILLKLLSVRPYRKEDENDQTFLYIKVLQYLKEVDSDPLDLALEILPESEKARDALVCNLLWAAAHWDVIYHRTSLLLGSREREPVRVDGLTCDLGKEVFLKHGSADWIFDLLISKMDEKEHLGIYSRTVLSEIKPLADKFGLVRALAMINEKDLSFASLFIGKHFPLASLSSPQVIQLLNDLIAIKTPEYTEANRVRSSLFGKLREKFPEEIRAAFSQKPLQMEGKTEDNSQAD